MENSKSYFNNDNKKVEIWHEEVNARIDYWERIDGISYSLTEEEYQKRLREAEQFHSQFK